jgi:lactate dehydrogenase-like 2-hydroxyacid dehydrogenase
MVNIQDGKFAHDATVAPPPGRVFPLFSLKGKTAIVSGGTTNIGLAAAQALAEAGANVAIWYNFRKEEAEKSAAKIEAEYGVKCESAHLLLFHSANTTHSPHLNFQARRIKSTSPRMTPSRPPSTPSSATSTGVSTSSSPTPAPSGRRGPCSTALSPCTTR